MSKLFIIGSGFSKAFHTNMPLLTDLGENLDWAKVPVRKPEHQRLSADVEGLLSYLYQEMPWKSSAARHLDKAIFYAISQQIADYITLCEIQAFEQPLKSWGIEFVTYLHKTQATVVTLNYDTILERLTGHMERETVGRRPYQGNPYIERDLVLDDLYRLPMLPLEERTRNYLGKFPLPTYRLLKPHGSVNWYFFGSENSAGEQVYYDGIPGFYPDHVSSVRHDSTQLREINKRDLVPLIIPPVAEKSGFYRSHLVKILWSDFAEAIEHATEIYFVGYSLPKTDLSMRLFLTSIIGDSRKAIYLVNRDTSQTLKQNYMDVLHACEWKDQYLGQTNAVELMVSDLTKEYGHKRGIAINLALQNELLVQCPECGDYAVPSSKTLQDFVELRQRAFDQAHEMFQKGDLLIQPFNNDVTELMFMIDELGLNRGYSFNCPCGYIHN